MVYCARIVVKHRPTKNIDDLEIAVAEYFNWFTHRRLHALRRISG